MKRSILSLLLLLIPVSWPQGQTSSTISGTIQDQASAMISGAKVSVRNTETNQLRETMTDSAGRYVFAELRVGRYEVRATQTGFRPAARLLNLTIGEKATLTLTLEISVEAGVTVVDATPLINTTSAELSYLVSERAIRELPLNGRNYTDLALLQPGVAAFPQRDGGSVVAHGLGMTINGQDIRSNVFLLDGTLLNDLTNGPAGSAAGTALGTEMIREFRVESNSYSAEFGRNFGGQINAISKSGSNALHGSLYHFLRNDNLDARNFFDREPLGKPEFKRNQFGGAVGGPLRQNRTFFFGGAELLRERRGLTIQTIVPDAKARLGTLVTRNAQGQIVESPTTISPAVKPYLDAYPLPNGPALNGGVGNLARFLFRFNQRLDQEYLQGRIDHVISDRQQLFGRFTFDQAAQYLPTDFPQFPRTFLSRNQFGTGEHSWVASDRTINTLRLGFSRTRIGQDVESNVPSSVTPFVPGRLLGSIDIGGIPRFGTQSSVNVQLTQNVVSLSEQLSHTRGKHLIKLGGMFEHYQANMVNPTFSLGIYNFPDLASFLGNRPNRFIGLTPEAQFDRYWRFALFGIYLQDDYKVSSRLTLNLGLRYEYSSTPREKYNRDVSLRRLTDTQVTIGPLYQNPTNRNISPRIGFALDLFGKGQTSLRGGYGLYFNTNQQQHLIVTVTNPPFTPRPVIVNPTFPNPPFNRTGTLSIRPIEWNIRNPSLHVYNLNLQQQMPFGTVLTVGYAGSRGVHLWRNTDANIVPPVRQADGSWVFPAGAPRLNPAFSTIELKQGDGNSWYNALIFELRKRFSNGIDFQSSYTFARTIDTTQASTFFSDATNATVSALPELPGLNYNKGLADFHVKHNWIVNFNWEVPFARRLKGGARVILHGWNLVGIGQMRSGNPLTVFLASNRSRSQWNPSSGPGLGQDRPSMAAERTYASAVIGRPDQYFDPTAFSLQPTGTLGSTGRNAFIGPNLRTFDLALVKNARLPRLGESGQFQLRFEAFNLFNRANFGTPGLQVFAGTPDASTQQPALSSFGVIRSTVTSARQLQVAVRLSF
ncbi:MAG: hypothetical protein EBU88_02665 [Acidobacteria bacterium]|nr:hypothetical protein [Acidobacteriota bacterium]